MAKRYRTIVANPPWAIEHHVGAEKPVCADQWCCGCDEHPAGKSWGWNREAWDQHYAEHHNELMAP